MPTFSYLAGYRINLNRPIVFLYSNSRHRESNHGHTPTHNSLREKKGSVSTPNKEARNLSREGTRKWRGVPCSRIGRIKVNMILQKAIYRCNPVPIKISISFVTEREKNYPKMDMELQKTADRQKELKQHRKNYHSKSQDTIQRHSD